MVHLRLFISQPRRCYDGGGTFTAVSSNTRLVGVFARGWDGQHWQRALCKRCWGVRTRRSMRLLASSCLSWYSHDGCVVVVTLVICFVSDGWWEDWCKRHVPPSTGCSWHLQSQAAGKSGGVPFVCGRKQGFGTTGSTQRRVSGDGSTTTSSREKKNAGTDTAIGVLALSGGVVGLPVVFVLGCVAFRSDPCPMVPLRGTHGFCHCKKRASLKT